MNVKYPGMPQKKIFFPVYNQKVYLRKIMNKRQVFPHKTRKYIGGANTSKT